LLIDDTHINPYWLDTRNDLYNDMCLYYNKNNNTLPGKGMFVLDEIPNANKIILNIYFNIINEHRNYLTRK